MRTRTPTNRIYRHLIRQRQQYGAAFDRVVREAREAFGDPGRRGGIGVNSRSTAVRALSRHSRTPPKMQEGPLCRPFVTRPTGFEPVTSCSGGKRSIH